MKHIRLSVLLALAGALTTACGGGDAETGPRTGAGSAGQAGGMLAVAGMSNPSGGMGGSGSFGNAGNTSGGIGGVAGIVAPVDAGDPNECSGVQEMAENMVQPVDIIVGVDTSGSMGEEIAFVQQHLNAFSQQIIDSGIDVHVILLAQEGTADTGMANCVVFWPGTPCVSLGGGNFGVCIGAPLGSGMCPADANLPNYAHVNVGVGSNDVLNVFISAYPQYKQYLRPGSLKTFVSVTDDDATDGPYNNGDAFIAAVAALDPDPLMWASWKYSSIFCKTQCPAAAAIGAVHADLVAKTGGVGGDLCLQDFGPVFDELATAVAEAVTLACEWEIPPVPMGETFDADKTNVELTLDGSNERLPRVSAAADCGDAAAWHYDDEASPTKVLACPSVCTRIQSASQANVELIFGCATEIFVPE